MSASLVGSEMCIRDSNLPTDSMREGLEARTAAPAHGGLGQEGQTCARSARLLKEGRGAARPRRNIRGTAQECRARALIRDGSYNGGTGPQRGVLFRFRVR
eukprot:1008219-Alexandrium_andersonii.AAC.1